MEKEREVTHVRGVGQVTNTRATEERPGIGLGRGDAFTEREGDARSRFTRCTVVLPHTFFHVSGFSSPPAPQALPPHPSHPSGGSIVLPHPYCSRPQVPDFSPRRERVTVRASGRTRSRKAIGSSGS